MKVKFDLNGTLTLIPEGEEDEGVIRALGAFIGPRSMMINHRGYQYMSPQSTFFIQKMPSND